MKRYYIYYRNELTKRANIKRLDAILNDAKNDANLRRNEYEMLLKVKEAIAV